jgi:hypothetical protein
MTSKRIPIAALMALAISPSTVSAFMYDRGLPPSLL